MSLFKALQSFAFYLASCGPCNREMERRRLKRDVKRQQQEKARERDGATRDGDAIYQQPSAFSTNPYWLEEFHMGPHTNRKKNTAKSASQRHLTSSSGDTASVGGFSIATTTMTYNTTNVDLSPNSPNANSTTFPRFKQNEDPSEANLTIAMDLSRSPGSVDSGTRGIQGIDLTASRRPSRTVHEYSRQRDWDEERPFTSQTRGEFSDSLGPNGYFDRRKNPPVNDLHPPIVRQPSNRSATQWMMAPPPPAKVMEGRRRDRSDSWQSCHSQSSF